MNIIRLSLVSGTAVVIVASASVIAQSTPTTLAESVSIVATESIGRNLPREFKAPLSPKESVPLEEFIEIKESCGPHFEGSCVKARSGPGETYPSITSLRNGVVLKTAEKISGTNHDWYEIIFDEPLLYPDRVTGPWYVAADYVEPFLAQDSHGADKPVTVATTSPKTIYINRTKQTLSAYQGDELFMEQKISTGLEPNPTPLGDFAILYKTPSRYMQGPLAGFPTSDVYDLPGVPWDLYFTNEGAAIHGAYWHTAFGREHSHGCVNLPIDQARKIYDWADIGTKVVVRD